MKSLLPLIVVITFCGGICGSAMAHPARPQQADATIRSIDYQAKTLFLEYRQSSGPDKLSWKAATEFLRGKTSVDSSEVKAGQHVLIYYHSPFFGKPFITKLVVQPD